ncbi:MAG: peroxiredoxin [Acidobacteriota bacterium]
MSIQAGDKMPEGQLRQLTEDGIEAVDVHSLFDGKKVALFAVPGAFTPTCAEAHVPSFLVNADRLRERGIERIYCVTANDPFVTAAWAKSLNAGDFIDFYSDGNGDYARALGLELDLSVIGLGTRVTRFAAVIDDGTVTYLGVEPGREVSVSSGDAVLESL